MLNFNKLCKLLPQLCKPSVNLFAIFIAKFTEFTEFTLKMKDIYARGFATRVLKVLKTTL